IDTSWNRVAGGPKIGELLSQVSRDFDDLHTEKSVPQLLEARTLMAPTAKAGDAWAVIKLQDADEAIGLCVGLRTEVQADAPSYVPGATAKLQLTALNRSPLPITLAGMHLTGWVPDTDALVK